LRRGDWIYESLKMSSIEDWKIMDIEMRKSMKKIEFIFLNYYLKNKDIWGDNFMKFLII
jgi:hypothetical protein